MESSSTTVDAPPGRDALIEMAFEDPIAAVRSTGDLSLFEFIELFWNEVSNDQFLPNWHIEKILCPELERIAYRVGAWLPKEYDLLINIPPGTTKTITCSIMFPVWCWTRWYWMRFICASHSDELSLESAEKSRDVMLSAKFKMMYPDLTIREDKSAKGNFRVVKREQVYKGQVPRLHHGGGRYSTSVRATTIGFHGHINIWDDLIDPKGDHSDLEYQNANYWMDRKLSTRKVDKRITVTVGIMQRLHQNDPTGHLLAKRKGNIRLICLPGEIINYAHKVNPPELVKYYKNGLLDPIRMDFGVLKDLEADLGQYGYAGQIGQDPTPPGGGMFKVDHFRVIDVLPAQVNFIRTIRYWDKAGTAGGRGAYTAGVKMSSLANGKFIIEDVIRGRWSSEEREDIIREAAEADGVDVAIYIEQEPGSGGKESAESTIRNLAGFACGADPPQGDKPTRADPFSVQVNYGNVLLLKGDWNYAYIEEHRYFPHGTYKDQVDASSGAFNKLAGRREARMLSRETRTF